MSRIVFVVTSAIQLQSFKRIKWTENSTRGSNSYYIY